MTEDPRERFIVESTVLEAPPLLPELRLHLASAITPMWTATQAWLDQNLLEPPFWAFAWPGGQAVARWLLDHPEEARGKLVLDLATGSGLCAVAAALAGAARVVAVDLDALALVAAGLNAAANGVTIERCAGSIAALDLPAADLVLAGDVFYDPTVADAARSALQRQLDLPRAGPPPRVLVGDPGRPYLPAGLDLVAELDVPVASDVESSAIKRTRVLSVRPGAL